MQSIFGPEERRIRHHWRSNGRRRAYLSAFVGGMATSLPLIALLLLPPETGDPARKSLSQVIGGVSFWPVAVIEPLMDYVFPPTFDEFGNIQQWYQPALYYLASLPISATIYSLCAFCALTWLGRRKSA